MAKKLTSDLICAWSLGSLTGSGHWTCILLTHSHPELKDFSYIVFVDSSRRYVDCSDDVLDFLGYTRPDFLKKTIDDLSYWLEDVPELFKDFLRRGKQAGTYILKHKNGFPLPIQYRSFAFPDGCKAAGWTPIKDWKTPYLAAISERDSGKLGRRIDVALAAIYRRLYANMAEAPVPDCERAALAEALSSLSSLRKKVPTALSPELLEFEKTRSALLRLAATRRDEDAVRVLFEEHRRLIETSIQHYFDSTPRDKMLPALLDRIALKARYYDPETNPEVWLQDCIHLESRRLRMELDQSRMSNGHQPQTPALE
jgi:hypothetical protein